MGFITSFFLIFYRVGTGLCFYCEVWNGVFFSPFLFLGFKCVILSPVVGKRKIWGRKKIAQDFNQGVFVDIGSKEYM